VLSGLGSLESVISDGSGRLYYTDMTRSALMRLDGPAAAPVEVAPGIASPGGLALDGEGRLIVGQGNSLVNGGLGNLIGLASLLRYDPAGGAVTPYASGLSMANGLARGRDGYVYASDDLGLGIDRVAPDGTVERFWAPVISANGLAIDAAGDTLYAAQTFQPAAIQSFDLATGAPTGARMTAGLADIAAGLDGMTIDGTDRLFVAANQGGEVWRVEPDGSYCALATGLGQPSAVSFGSAAAGQPGFAATSLFAVTFSGTIVEMPNARTLPAEGSGSPSTGQPGASTRKCAKKKAKRKGKKRKRTKCKRKKKR
jgi:sugar lactone lactonase YvrE